jgi:hypothetical protein
VEEGPEPVNLFGLRRIVVDDFRDGPTRTGEERQWGWADLARITQRSDFDVN